MALVRIHGSNDLPIELTEYEAGSDPVDLGKLLEDMTSSNPAYEKLLIRGGGLRTDLNILINGRHCMFLEGLQTKIGREDKVDILLPVTGG